MGLKYTEYIDNIITMTPVKTKPTWDQLLCSEQTGVQFIQVKLTKIPTWELYLKFGLYRILVYSGFSLVQV